MFEQKLVEKFVGVRCVLRLFCVNEQSFIASSPFVELIPSQYCCREKGVYRLPQEAFVLRPSGGSF